MLHALGARAPVTLQLTLMAAALAILVGVPLGVLSAVRRGSLLDQIVTTLAMTSASLPSFWIGLTLITIFSVGGNWFPVSGYGPPSAGLLTHLLVRPAGDRRGPAQHGPDPAFHPQFHARRAARRLRAHGPCQRAFARTVLIKHAFRNARTSVLTVIGLTVAGLIGGTIVTETVFGLPGVGNLVVSAVLRRDYPVIDGALLVISGIYVLINLAVDLLYQDPTCGSADDPAVAVFRRLARYPLAFASLVALVLVLGAALLAPWIAPYSPERMDILHRLAPPSAAHWPVRMISGATSLARPLRRPALRHHRHAGRLFSVVLGTAMGLLSGIAPALDGLLMRFADALMAFPDILLAIALMAALGPSLLDVVLALGIVYTPRVARLVRGAVLVLRQLNFVEAAEAMGASDARIVRVHLLPNLVSPLLVQATFIFAAAVLTEAALSFLGAGIPPPTPSWGNMIAGAQQYLDRASWLIFAPGVAILLTVLALQIVGDALRDAFDPSLGGSCEGDAAPQRRGPAHDFPHTGGGGEGGRRHQLRSPPRRDLGPRRRIWQRKIRNLAFDYAAFPGAAGPHRRRPDAIPDAKRTYPGSGPGKRAADAPAARR